MAMVSDQMDMIASTMTTPRATQFIDCHMPTRLNVLLIASMQLLLLLFETEIDCQVVNHGNGLPVEHSRLELPLLHGVDRRLVETERQRLEDADVGDVAAAVDDGLEDHDSLDP